jgi:hypothetical protein
LKRFLTILLCVSMTFPSVPLRADDPVYSRILNSINLAAFEGVTGKCEDLTPGESPLAKEFLGTCVDSHESPVQELASSHQEIQNNLQQRIEEKLLQMAVKDHSESLDCEKKKLNSLVVDRYECGYTRHDQNNPKMFDETVKLTVLDPTQDPRLTRKQRILSNVAVQIERIRSLKEQMAQRWPKHFDKNWLQKGWDFAGKAVKGAWNNAADAWGFLPQFSQSENELPEEAQRYVVAIQQIKAGIWNYDNPHMQKFVERAIKDRNFTQNNFVWGGLCSFGENSFQDQVLKPTLEQGKKTEALLKNTADRLKQGKGTFSDNADYVRDLVRSGAYQRYLSKTGPIGKYVDALNLAGIPCKLYGYHAGADITSSAFVLGMSVLSLGAAGASGLVLKEGAKSVLGARATSFLQSLNQSDKTRRLLQKSAMITGGADIATGITAGIVAIPDKCVDRNIKSFDYLSCKEGENLNATESFEAIRYDFEQAGCVMELAMTAINMGTAAKSLIKIKSTWPKSGSKSPRAPPEQSTVAVPNKAAQSAKEAATSLRDPILADSLRQVDTLSDEVLSAAIKSKPNLEAKIKELEEAIRSAKAQRKSKGVIRKLEEERDSIQLKLDKAKEKISTLGGMRKDYKEWAEELMNDELLESSLDKIDDPIIRRIRQGEEVASPPVEPKLSNAEIMEIRGSAAQIERQIVEEGIAVVQPTRNLTTLRIQAERAQAHLNSIITDLTKQTGAMLSEMKPRLATKEDFSIVRKVKGSAHKRVDLVTDYARQSLVFESPRKLYQGLARLEQQLTSRGIDIVQITDRILDPRIGYRDLHIKIRIPPENHIAEIQLHIQSVKKVKDGIGDDIYRNRRQIEALLRTDQVRGTTEIALSQQRDRLHRIQEVLFTRAFNESVGQ